MPKLPKKFVDRVDHYERDDDGYWIYLASGWIDPANPGATIIVESTWREALYQLEGCTRGTL